MLSKGVGVKRAGGDLRGGGRDRDRDKWRGGCRGIMRLSLRWRKGGNGKGIDQKQGVGEEGEGGGLTLAQHARLCSDRHSGKSCTANVQQVDLSECLGGGPGLKELRCLLYSAHHFSTCRMGTSPRDSVVDPQGESWEVSNLYVADGSVLPNATGELSFLFPAVEICEK